MSAGVGERIKARRIELNITQAQLAERMGLAETSSISTYERETANLNTDKLIKLAKALDTTVGYFFGESSGNNSSDEIELLSDYRRLNSRDKKIVSNQIKCFLSA